MARCRFVAEVSSNHNRSLERALALVDAAADIGCDAVKFQLFKIKELFAREILERSQRHRDREQWELPEEFIPLIHARCAERGIAFSCTPFYLQAVELLQPYVQFYKIASYELLWSDLIRACSRTGKPLVISTGMATLDEIRRAAAAAREAGCSDLTLLHCVSAYPAKADECNLAFMETMRRETGCRVGWSDHSVNPAVVLRAVQRWGAEMVEFHFDTDERGVEFGGGHCWLPEQFRRVIELVRQAEAADGDGEIAVSAVEEEERLWRADPSDGLRPFKALRESFGKGGGG